jgi:hypothetical protein
MSKRVEFKIDSDFSLTNLQAKVILDKEGKELFERLGMTPAAEQWLAEHPKLKEAIEAW